MNLALKKTHLAASLRTIALCCVFLGAGLASTVAVSQDRYDQGRGQDNRGDGRRDARAEQRQDPRQDPRNQREEQRRVIQMQDADGGDSRRGARMSADERRDLRRQINEVGQDIYSRPPRR